MSVGGAFPSTVEYALISSSSSLQANNEMLEDGRISLLLLLLLLAASLVGSSSRPTCNVGVFVPLGRESRGVIDPTKKDDTMTARSRQ